MSVAEFLKGAGEGQTDTVYLSPDPAAVSLAEAAAEASVGGTLADPDTTDDARQAVRDSSWAFVVSSIPASQWRHLVDRHPPTDEQREQARAEGQTLSFDLVRFPNAAIAACLRSATNPDGARLEFDRPRWDPDGGLTVDPDAAEVAAQVFDTFGLGEWTLLWTVVNRLNGINTAVRHHSFATGSAKTRSGGR